MRGILFRVSQNFATTAAIVVPAAPRRPGNASGSQRSGPEVGGDVQVSEQMRKMETGDGGKRAGRLCGIVVHRHSSLGGRPDD